MPPTTTETATGPTRPSEDLGLGTRRVGIVDLGSNTARLVVFLTEPGRWFRLVDAIREPVRLAEGMGPDGRLKTPAMKRATAALQLFADYARAARLDAFEIIATSAVRDAANRDEFLERIEPLDLELRILSGEEEAELGVLAVANGMALDDAWVIDLGGGSAQLSLMRDRHCEGGRAFPLGAVRITEELLTGNDPPKKRQVKAVEEAVDEHLGKLAERMRGDRLPIVAMGGTVRNLARIAQKKSGYPLSLLHNHLFTRTELEDVTHTLLSLPLAQRQQISGLNSDRADVITAGALVFRRLLQLAEREALLISGYGVREGAFFRHFLPAPHLLTDVRRFHVRNLFEQYAQPEDHTRKVVELSLQLFDILAPLHELGPPDRELLEAAAVLHDIGMTVGYYQHHRHGCTLVSSSNLPGFDHREQALVCQMVRYHRKGNPTPGSFAPLFSEGDPERLAILSLLLRLAEQLERSRTGRIRRVTARIDADAVILVLEADEEPVVEMWEAAKHADLFERVFRRAVCFDWRPSAPSTSGSE